MKSRERQEARHVARVGENKNAYMCFVGKPGEKKPLEKLKGNSNTNLTPQDGIMWTEFTWLRIHTIGGLLCTW
jgi:hypothetical protein